MKLKLAILSLALLLSFGVASASETDWQGIDTGLNSGTTPDGTVMVAPTSNVPNGTYTSQQTVTLTAAQSNSIRYTLDGSAPACPATGTLYAGAFAVNATSTLKAIACYQGDNSFSSPTSTYSYTFVCAITTVANGTVGAYPTCAITCNAGFVVSANTCVPGGGGGGGGGGSYSGGGGPTKPAGGFVFKINNDAISTLSRNVTLTIDGGSESKKMAIANGTNFANIGQDNYATSLAWVLTEGNGEKTVCIKFYNQSGYYSDSVCDTIYLGTPPAGYTGATTTTTTTTTGTGTGTTTTTQTGQSRTDQLISLTHYGERSANVSELQQLLKNLGFFTYPTITGYYGAATQAAVRAYQNSQSGGTSTGSGLVFNFRGAAIPLAKPLIEMNRDELIAFLLQLIAAMQH